MCGSTSSKAWLQAVASSSCDNKSVDARPRKKTIGEQDAKKKDHFCLQGGWRSADHYYEQFGAVDKRRMYEVRRW